MNTSNQGQANGVLDPQMQTYGNLISKLCFLRFRDTKLSKATIATVAYILHQDWTVPAVISVKPIGTTKHCTVTLSNGDSAEGDLEKLGELLKSILTNTTDGTDSNPHLGKTFTAEERDLLEDLLRARCGVDLQGNLVYRN